MGRPGGGAGRRGHLGRGATARQRRPPGRLWGGAWPRCGPATTSGPTGRWRWPPWPRRAGSWRTAASSDNHGNCADHGIRTFAAAAVVVVSSHLIRRVSAVVCVMVGGQNKARVKNTLAHSWHDQGWLQPRMPECTLREPECWSHPPCSGTYIRCTQTVSCPVRGRVDGGWWMNTGVINAQAHAPMMTIHSGGEGGCRKTEPDLEPSSPRSQRRRHSTPSQHTVTARRHSIPSQHTVNATVPRHCPSARRPSSARRPRSQAGCRWRGAWRAGRRG